MKQHLTCKDIAKMTDLSVRSVKRNSARLGIKAAEVRVNKRVILYRSKECVELLKFHGFDIRAP
jgi:hypothetical protein